MGLTADSLSFDVDGWQPVPEDDGALPHGIVRRRWRRAPDDRLTYQFFPSPDPPPVDPARVAEVRAFARELAVSRGGGLIEAGPGRLAGVATMRLMMKLPLEPVGFIFTAGISFNASGAGFSLNLECPEVGVTGARETAVAQALGIDIAPGFFKRLFGKDEWFADPYDASVRTDVMRCVADDAKYDAKFPDHPLSRLRRYLASLESSLALDGR